ncbi:MAG: hypothetical protein ABIG91_00880 [Patescibacteria group bacterium]
MDMKFMRSKKPLSLEFVGFLQALGLVFYCGLVSLLFWQGNNLFGNTPNYWGPVLFLIIFSFSALVCALVTLGYPFFIFWEEKKTKKALKLVSLTALWLLVFILLGLILALISK